MLKKILCGAVALAATSFGCAAAEWIHQAGEEDPFKGGQEHIVLALDESGAMVGFRCVDRASVAMMFVVSEKPKPEEAALVALMARMKLLVIVDDAPRVSLPAALEVTPDGERYRISASGPDVPALVLASASAKRRVALAAEVNGKILWSQSFGVSGSRSALQPLIAGCKLASAVTN